MTITLAPARTAQLHDRVTVPATTGWPQIRTGVVVDSDVAPFEHRAQVRCDMTFGGHLIYVDRDSLTVTARPGGVS